MMGIDGSGNLASICPMKDRLDMGNKLPRRFRLLLLHLVEAARHDLGTMGTKPERSIHAVRIRMKNLRAILLLVEKRVPQNPRRKIKDAAKSLKDAFSDQRDAHVITALRAKIEGRPPPVAGRAGTVSNVPQREVARLIRAIGSLRLDGLEWSDVLMSYERCYRRGRREMKACLARSEAKLLHRWRRTVKDLFYQSRALQPLSGVKRRARLAQRLGDRLGKWNDLEMLAGQGGGSGTRGNRQRIESRQKALSRVIFRTATKLFSDKPKKVTQELQRCVKMMPALAALCVRQA